MADYSDFFNDDDDEFLMSIPLERPAANIPSTSTSTSTSTSNNNSSSSNSNSNSNSSTVKTSSKTYLSHFTFGSHYVDKFDGEGYDEVENLEGLTVQQLKVELGMKSGHANRLHRWLKQRDGSDREDQNNIHRHLGLHQQQPARKKRRTSTSGISSPSSLSVYMAPEMKMEDDEDNHNDDGDDDCVIIIDDDDDEDEDEDEDEDCERISATQIQHAAAAITAKPGKDHPRHHHQSTHQSTPAKSPKKRTLRRLSVSPKKVTRYPNRMIRTLLTPHLADMVRPTDSVRIYLELPYEQKEKGKKLGARWDPKKKKWYVMSDHDASNDYDQMRHLVSLFGHDNSKYPFDCDVCGCSGACNGACTCSTCVTSRK